MARLLLVGSSGGHLAQLMALRPWWSDHERAWATFSTPDAVSRLEDETVTWTYHPTTRNLFNAVRNLVLAVGVVRRWRPDVVVSTGAGVALPFFLAALVLRVPRVYVEVYDRIDSRTLAGRLCQPLSTVFCVQWQEQQALYPGSVLIGPLL